MHKFPLVACCFFAVLLVSGTSAQGRNCPQVCPFNYAPVCGRNGNGQTRQFSNECALNVFNCNNPNQAFRVQSKGEC